MLATHFNGFLHQCFLYACCTVDYFVYTGIYFFPETRHTTHYCRTYFLDSHLNILRTKVDVHFSTYTQAPATECTFEYMGKRQEVDNYVVFTESRESIDMSFHYRFVTSMAQHHTLAFTSSSTGIKNIHQIFFFRLGCTLVYFRLMFTILTQSQEIVHVNGSLVIGIELHLAVEHDDLFQRLAQRHHSIGHIVLLLFAHKQETNLRIFQNIMHLSFRAGSIQRNSYRTHTKRTEVYKQRFRLVLCKHTDVFLRLYAQFNQGVRNLGYRFRELVPRSRDPCSRFIVTVFQCSFFAILLCLAMYQVGE